MAVRSIDPFIEEIPYPNGLYRARIFHNVHEAAFPAHYHKSDLEIIIPTGMRGEFVCNGKYYEVDQYSVCFAAPGAVHSNRFKPEVNGSHFTLQINMQKLHNIFADYMRVGIQESGVFLSMIPPLIADRTGEFRKMAFSLSQIGSTLSGVDIKGDYAALLADLGTIFSILRSAAIKVTAENSPASWQTSVHRILDVIGPFGLGAASLSEIAEKSALSKSHMCSLFKKATGGTIQNHILELRIKYAAGLLLDKGLNVSQAAAESGFENLSHFIKVFRKVSGVTPKQWALRKQS
ncbi:MAG: helix-turn-helix transcriptional regulator [Fibrobacteres bacterium]|nr:helix-turn-helix transcriptional regulator [Fibrobacterota bacterium]